VAIKRKEDRPAGKIEIDLSGPNGNAYVLLNLADRLGRRLGYDHDHRERILDEMKLTDYEGLVHTFDREFGHFVILWK
jgi:hypothetical protein